MKKTLLGALVAVVVMATCGCGGSVFGEKISEGVITYKLEYPGDANGSSLLMMLPPQMTLAFKDNNTAMVINGFAGCFSLRNIANYSTRQCHTMLSIGFNQKYMSVSEYGVSPFGTSRMSDIELTQTQDTTTICGYLCHKVVAHSKQCNRDFSFWYTQDIDLDCAGSLMPGDAISGVLMKFDVEMSGIYLQAKAVQVTPQQVSDDIFEIPSDYKEVSRNQLESVIQSFNTPNISGS